MARLLPLREEQEIVCTSSDGRALIFHSSLLQPKTSRTTQGVGVMALKKGRTLTDAAPLAESPVKNLSRYRVRSLPAAGAILRPEDKGEEQIRLELE